MRFAVIHKPSASVTEIVERLKAEAEKRGFRESEEPDVIFAVGGDGTLLKAVKLGKPVICIRAGRRGFLMDVEPSKIPEALDRLNTGDYRVEKLNVLEVGGAIAFNDVTVVADEAETILLKLNAADHSMEAEGDGVVISTPQGSTGWSLSALGPYVDKEIDAIVVTLLNPILSPVRSLVLKSKAVRVSMEDKGYHQWAKIFVDGDLWRRIEPGEWFEIGVGEKKAVIYRFFNSNPLRFLNCR